MVLILEAGVYLTTDRVALYFVKVRVLGGGAVEELAPEELTVQLERRLALLDLNRFSNINKIAVPPSVFVVPNPDP
jgi:hypothetical protein